MMNSGISVELFREIEAFLYAEARMLENNSFDEWLNCFTDDVHYWMPVRENVEASVAKSTESDSFALFDDDKKSLQLRVLRVQTGEAHAEVPPSTTLRLISNIVAEPNTAAADASLAVSSSFMVYQERRAQHGVTFFGRRFDVMRRENETLRIARRKIDLAQTILPTTISIFF
jgi:dibenzofuran dioxygenase beta subunit